MDLVGLGVSEMGFHHLKCHSKREMIIQFSGPRIWQDDVELTEQYHYQNRGYIIITIVTIITIITIIIVIIVITIVIMIIK